VKGLAPYPPNPVYPKSKNQNFGNLQNHEMGGVTLMGSAFFAFWLSEFKWFGAQQIQDGQYLFSCWLLTIVQPITDR
jgi:hypothetical protein